MMMYYGMPRSRVIALDKSIAKLYLLNLDPLLPDVKPLYPNLGRAAKKSARYYTFPRIDA